MKLIGAIGEWKEKVLKALYTSEQAVTDLLVPGKGSWQWVQNSTSKYKALQLGHSIS